MTETPKYLSIDIGGSSIKYGLLDHAGQLMERNKVITPQSLDPFVEKSLRLLTLIATGSKELPSAHPVKLILAMVVFTMAER